MIIIKSRDGKSIREYIGANINYQQSNRIIGQSKGDVLILEKGEDIVESSGYPLGNYSSKKRAEEVMAMIEHHIAAMHNDVNNRMNPIFTMPEK